MLRVATEAESNWTAFGEVALFDRSVVERLATFGVDFEPDARFDAPGPVTYAHIVCGDYRFLLTDAAESPIPSVEVVTPTPTREAIACLVDHLGGGPEMVIWRSDDLALCQVTATASMWFLAPDAGGQAQTFRDGTSFLLARVGADGVRVSLGATIGTNAGRPFVPGGEMGVRLTFWIDEAATLARPGQQFAVSWSGRAVATLTIESTAAAAVGGGDR